MTTYRIEIFFDTDNTNDHEVVSKMSDIVDSLVYVTPTVRHKGIRMVFPTAQRKT